MTGEEILRDATEMAKHYPGDRLRLTGEEILALVTHVRDATLEEAAVNLHALATTGLLTSGQSSIAAIAVQALKGKLR